MRFTLDAHIQATKGGGSNEDNGGEREGGGGEREGGRGEREGGRGERGGGGRGDEGGHNKLISFRQLQQNNHK